MAKTEDMRIDDLQDRFWVWWPDREDEGKHDGPDGWFGLIDEQAEGNTCNDKAVAWFKNLDDARSARVLYVAYQYIHIIQNY